MTVVQRDYPAPYPRPSRKKMLKPKVKNAIAALRERGRITDTETAMLACFAARCTHAETIEALGLECSIKTQQRRMARLLDMIQQEIRMQILRERLDKAAA